MFKTGDEVENIYNPDDFGVVMSPEKDGWFGYKGKDGRTVSRLAKSFKLITPLDKLL